MTDAARHLLAEVLQLPAHDRAEMAAELIASLDGQPDVDAVAAWADEIQRRARRVIEGATAASPWDTVKDRIERRLDGA